jgi:hypothetical protein
MRHNLLLFLAVAATPHLAQAERLTPCGARVVTSGWATSPMAGGSFKYQVTLSVPAAMRVQVRFNMQYAMQDAGLSQPLTLRPGRAQAIWLGTGRANPPIAAVMSSTTLTCAAAG